MILAVPRKVLVDLQAGSKVNIAVEKGRLAIEPQKARYTLTEPLRLRKRTDLALRPGDRAWLRARRVGSEEI